MCSYGCDELEPPSLSFSFLLPLWLLPQPKCFVLQPGLIPAHKSHPGDGMGGVGTSRLVSQASGELSHRFWASI